MNTIDINACPVHPMNCLQLERCTFNEDIVWLQSFFQKQDVDQSEPISKKKICIRQLDDEAKTTFLDILKTVHFSKSKEFLRRQMNDYHHLIQLSCLFSIGDRDIDCGEKYKNLIKLKSLKKSFPIRGLRIPSVKGISNKEVEKILVEEFSDFFNKWETLTEIYRLNYQEKEDKSLFLKDEIVAKLIKEINVGLKTVFGQGKAHSFLAAYQEWFQLIKSRGSYLMVRSSGAEDSLKTANAGGNISMSYVNPVLEDVSEAIGEVLSSYFSFSSLQNRLNAGCDPFEEGLQFSTALQELVGEVVGGDEDLDQIPSSVVFFSNEECYIGAEKFRISRGSATFGNGDGVVGNQGIACDTFLVLHSVARPDKLYLFYDNRKKIDRLAPVRNPQTGKIELKKIRNPSHLIMQPAVDKKTIETLFTWSILTEYLFEGKPVDGEFVIKGGRVFPVQARPTLRKQAEPTYLDFRKIKNHSFSPIQDKMQGEILVPGIAGALEITEKKQILHMATLAEAERSFNNKIHSVVIVSTEEPANSHPVVNFSWMGIPCLCVHDFEKTQQMIEKIDRNHSISVCVQTASVYLWKRQTPFKSCISSGYAIHPAKIAITRRSLQTPSPSLSMHLQPPKEVKNLINQMRLEEIRIFALYELKNHTWVQEFTERHRALENQIKGMNFVPDEVLSVLKASTSLDKRIKRAFREAELVFSANNQRVLEPLFHVKAIEALLLSSSKQTAVHQYSLLNIQEAFEAADKIVAYQNKLGHPAQFADLLLEGYATPVAIENEWEKFLFELEGLADRSRDDLTLRSQLETFRQTMMILRETGTIPFWMTFFFEAASKNHQTVQEKLNVLTLSQQDVKDIVFFVEVSQRIGGLKEQVTRFEHPDQCRNAWQELVNEGDQWMNSSFIGNWNALAPISHMIALKTMLDLVDLYDISIKTMKASASFSKMDQVRLFKEMLFSYRSLMEKWVMNIPNAGNFILHQDWPISRIFGAIQILLENCPDDDSAQLLRSMNFSVAAAMLGSRVDFVRHLPGTMEDIFTLIHQNLLASISQLSLNLFPDVSNHSLLPPLFQYALATIPTLKITAREINAPDAIDSFPRLQGVRVTENELSAYYNIPLRNHSGALEIIYDKRMKGIEIKGKLLGLSRRRWAMCIQILKILDQTQCLNLSSIPILSDQELMFSWKIQNQDSLNWALKIYHWLERLSLEARGSGTDGLLRFISNDPQHFECIQSIGQPASVVQFFIDSCASPIPEDLVPFLTSADARQKYGEIVENRPKSIDMVSLGVALYRSVFGSTRQKIEKLLVDSIENPDLKIPEGKELSVFKSFFDEVKLMENFTQVKLAILKETNGFQTSLFKYAKLVEKGLKYEEAVFFAADGLFNLNSSVRAESINLCQVLIRKNVCIEPLVMTVKKGIQNSNEGIRESALNVFKILFHNNQGYETASIAVIEYRESNGEVTDEILELLLFLLKKDLNSEEAMWFAKEYLLSVKNSLTSNSNRIFLEIFEIWIEKKQYEQEIAVAAKESLLNLHHLIRSKSVALCRLLIDKKIGLQIISIAVNEGIQSSDDGICKDSHKIFDMLSKCS